MKYVYELSTNGNLKSSATHINQITRMKKKNKTAKKEAKKNEWMKKERKDTKLLPMRFFIATIYQINLSVSQFPLDTQKVEIFFSYILLLFRSLYNGVVSSFIQSVLSNIKKHISLISVIFFSADKLI